MSASQATPQNWEDIRRRRLARSHLLERALRADLVEVVRDVCGIHAQVMGSAELALSARLDGITQEDVRAELWEHRSLIKTWTIRGTLHLHPAGDLPMWAAATRAVGQPDETEVVEAIADALDGRCLLREELAEEVAKRAGKWARERIGSGWAYLFGTAAALGKLCHGPPRGNKVTFVRTDQWAGWRDVNPDEALAEAASRFLATYGPAGRRQFAQERQHLVPEKVRERLKTHPKGRYEGIAGVPTLLVDGAVAGLWRQAKKGKRVEIAVEPIRRLSPGERRELEAEAARIGAFLGAEPILRVGRLDA